MSLTGNISRKQYLEGEGFPRGNDGISPTVEVSKTENGHRVEITDVYGTKSFDVKDGDKGEPGTPGEDYVLTEADKNEIAEKAAEMVDVPGSGGNVDLTGYATEQFVRDGFQPKGDYLTSYTETDPTVPSWAKQSQKPSYTASEVGALPASTTIPTKVSQLTNDKGYLTEHQDLSAYALKTELPSVPVQSVNGKTGAVNLSASDVGAMPNGTKIPSKTSDLTNDSGFITGYTETDPTVPAWAKATTKPSYSKSEVGLGNVDNVKQYSASNPPPYPVTSVNGKTGAVSLDASAVGARPSTWMPSASDVGALPASTTIPSKLSQLQNDVGFLTEISKGEIVQQVIAALPVYNGEVV